MTYLTIAKKEIVVREIGSGYTSVLAGLNEDNVYYIPIFDRCGTPLSLSKLKYYIDLFVRFALYSGFNNEYIFMLKPIGLQYYSAAEMVKLFEKVLWNKDVKLPKEYLDVIKDKINVNAVKELDINRTYNKTSKKDKEEIRKLVSEKGVSCSEIAKLFNITYQNAYKIAKRDGKKKRN